MKIFIFHASAGHGHRKIAEVLESAFKRRQVPGLECVVEDSLDSTPSFFKKAYVDTYFYAVKYIPAIWGWCYEMLDRPWLYALARPFRSLSNRIYGQKLLRRVIDEAPDLIICTHFFTAELFATAKRKGLLKSRLLVQISDFMPHTFWVNSGTDDYWVMGKDGADDLKRRGVSPEQIIAGGIPVEEVFRPNGKKFELRPKWGLTNDRLTLLLTSGSFGLGPTEEILKELEAFKDRIQCLVVCGNNAELKTRLENTAFGFPIRIFGFVNFMADLMETSDLMIAKTGGATTSESLAKGLPMVVMKPIPGQETRNAAVLRQNDAAFFMDLPEEIVPIVRTVLDDPQAMEKKRLAISNLARPHAADELVAFALNACKK